MKFRIERPIFAKSFVVEKNPPALQNKVTVSQASEIYNEHTTHEPNFPNSEFQPAMVALPGMTSRLLTPFGMLANVPFRPRGTTRLSLKI